MMKYGSGAPMSGSSKISCREVVTIEPEGQKDLVELCLLFAIPDPGRQ